MSRKRLSGSDVSYLNDNLHASRTGHRHQFKNPLIHNLCIKGRISRGSTLIDRILSGPLIEGGNLYVKHAGYRFMTITESPFPIKGHSKPVFRQIRCKAITPVSVPLSGQFPCLTLLLIAFYTIYFTL